MGGVCKQNNEESVSIFPDLGRQASEVEIVAHMNSNHYVFQNN